MIRFGIIGTNFITDWFIDTINQLDDVEVTALYSRTESRVKEYAENHSILHTFTSLEEMAQSDVIDAIYIASPNSLHAEQSILFMQHGKHVLCEKPLASNVQEVTRMIEVAKENEVVLLEALRNLFMPNLERVQQAMERIAPVRRAVFNKSQYSSRYDLYKNGENPNTFNPEFSNGSLMDLGVYLLGPALKLFGQPNEVQASGVTLESGVDGSGTVILSYDDLDVIVMHSKIHATSTPSEIIGEKGRIVINDIATCDEVRLELRDGTSEIVSESQNAPMSYEIETFVRAIEARNLETVAHSATDMVRLADVMTNVRTQLGVVYPADK
ncbi:MULTISPECIES: Gfo/Idh/MocA family protein [Exiguobacterium]|uniref:Gfo/Idh/MocA family protein n=1 Tax=unclassified Exiguobacterium TaxID=2644629 RepID=UPI001BEC1925|nr:MULTISPECIES: Gfo/Idh/MocA family oxidoreductase [unclassified Exiguobacterium]